MKPILNCSAFFLFLLFGNYTFSQINGYGTQAHGSVSWSSGIHYLDDVRAKVTSFSTPPSTVCTVAVANATGAFST